MGGQCAALMPMLYVILMLIDCFFFSSRRRHTRSDRDWSSDVCSSDLTPPTALLSSGLNSAIRTERGLSYAAYAPYDECAIPVGGVYASTPKPDKVLPLMLRSEERRVGKECRSRWSPYH